MVCLHCLTQSVSVSGGNLSCPCCYDHPLNSDFFWSPSAITMGVLGSLHVSCGKECNRTVRADNYTKHITSNCRSYYVCSTLSPSKTTIRDILNKPSNIEPTRAEKQVAENVLKRMFTENPDSVVKVPTHGQVWKKYRNAQYCNSGFTHTLFLISQSHWCKSQDAESPLHRHQRRLFNVGHTNWPRCAPPSVEETLYCSYSQRLGVFQKMKGRKCWEVLTSPSKLHLIMCWLWRQTWQFLGPSYECSHGKSWGHYTWRAKFIYLHQHIKIQMAEDTECVLG